MSGEVVWSINIMIGILLLAVGYVIYWVFKYDEWNPNPITTSHITTQSEHIDSADKESSVGTG